MKKLVSLLLAAMMLLSCTALAETITSESIDVREETDEYSGTDVSSINTPKTELWLQVDANGQIDVTVPLVLVFKTNIDGGEAETADNGLYKIINRSSADLVVTNIAVDVEDEDADENVKNPMELVPYAAAASLAEDTYGVKLNVAESTSAKGTAYPAFEHSIVETGGVFTATGDGDTPDYVASKTALEGGLFLLNKAQPDGTGTDTVINAQMSTGSLSFVTSRKTNEDGEDIGVDPAKGVKLLTITYTVAINTADAIGDPITTSPTNP